MLWICAKKQMGYTIGNQRRMNENIDQMLMERHLAKKERRANSKHHMKGRTMSGGHRLCADRSGSGDPRKRTEEDDVRFAESFEKMVRKALEI